MRDKSRNFNEEFPLTHLWKGRIHFYGSKSRSQRQKVVQSNEEHFVSFRKRAVI